MLDYHLEIERIVLETAQNLADDQTTVSVEEHRERFVSARIFIGAGLQNSNSLVNLRKHPIQMLRQSLFIRRRKKNTRQTTAGATMVINERTVLYVGGLQSVEV